MFNSLSYHCYIFGQSIKMSDNSISLIHSLIPLFILIISYSTLRFFHLLISYCYDFIIVNSSFCITPQSYPSTTDTTAPLFTIVNHTFHSVSV